MKLGIVCTKPSPRTEMVRRLLAKNYNIVDVLDCDEAAGNDRLVVLGGDGSMLRAIHNFHHCGLPFYGINCGGVGFMLNEFTGNYDIDSVGSPTNIVVEINPMVAMVVTVGGSEYSSIIINELCLIRSVFRPCNINVNINSRERISKYSGDGIIVSTALGSTAYNSSVGGTLVPPGLGCLSMVALSPDRCCAFRNAIVKDDSIFEFHINEPEIKEVSAFCDGIEYKNVDYAKTWLNRQQKIRLLFKTSMTLEEKVLERQFPKFWN
ncbi:MAG: NAD(+)/NADH kinase [Rickettsiales bacterium]|jgi:NAD+ kinase|nr:NAD(+)/NADH kinase [Rickettsiales bacterium]